MIMDNQSSSTINELVSIQELIKNGVTFIENVTIKRKPYPNLSSVYLIQPTKENLNFIQEDFGNK